MSVCSDSPFRPHHWLTVLFSPPIAHAQTLALAPLKPSDDVCISSSLFCVLSQTPHIIHIHFYNFSLINFNQNFISKRPPKLLSCGWTQLSWLLSLAVFDPPEFSFLGPLFLRTTSVPYVIAVPVLAHLLLISISLSMLGLHGAWYLTDSLCVFSLLPILAHSL